MDRVIFGVCLAFSVVCIHNSHVFAQKIFIEQEGQVVVEAENFSSRTSTETHEWFIIQEGGSISNSRGSGYIQALPDNGSGSSPQQPPFADYTVRIDTIGTYRLYVRWASPADSSDTFYLSIVELNDGPGGSIADWYRYVRISEALDFSASPTWFGSGGFERTDSPFTNGETPVIWPISVAGDYTIRFSMREDGVAIDAFVFQLVSLPAPTGDGPPESPILEDLTIATPAISSVTLGQFFSQELEAASGEPPYTWFIVEGLLPSGVDLSPDGVLSGIPTEASESNFTVRVEDSNGNFAEKVFTLKVLVTLPPPDIRINKVGTIPVPGRNMITFISVENIGETTASDLVVLDILDDSLELKSISANGTEAIPSFVAWSVPDLLPNEAVVFSHEASINPSAPFGKNVSTPVCTKEDWTEIATCVDEVSVPLGCNITCGGGCFLCTLDCIRTGWLRCSLCDTICLSCMAGCWATFFDDIHSCFKGKPGCRIPVDLLITGPKDPNEKIVVANKFIQPDQLLVYPIHFENIGDVEAIDVFVTDVLDSNLDASTLEILTPDGASFNASTRTLKWDLLGRNLQPGETGNVLFSIRPKSGLSSGTEIRNKAEIQFEIFETLITPEVVNIIDSTSPSCTMDSLPEETTSRDFSISWDGTDAVGEIDTYSIFVSVDGSGYTLFETTRETDSTFNGDVGKVYRFICIATDTAGNIEVQDPVAEAITGVRHPAVIEVVIDIQPGSAPNSINPNNRGVIPVAILTTNSFDAITVDPLSIRFGPDGASETHGGGHIEDVDGDGDDDMMLHFRTQDTGIQCGDTEAGLTGMTVDGQEIIGSDSIRTVGCR